MKKEGKKSETIEMTGAERKALGEIIERQKSQSRSSEVPKPSIKISDEDREVLRGIINKQRHVAGLGHL